MNNCQKKINIEQSGFTLIEVLVATTIFATVMTITMATISSSMNYRNKLREMRRASEEVSKFADIITRDVREAKSDTEISLYDCDWSANRCSRVADLEPGLLKSDNIDAEMMLLLSKHSSIIFAVKEGKVHYRRRDNQLNAATITSDPIAFLNANTEIISSADSNIAIRFGGFAPRTGLTSHLQSYLSFEIESKSNGYDNKAPSMRAKAEIDSSVTTRSYR